MSKYYEFRDVESNQLRICQAWGLKDPVNGSTALKQAEKALEEVGELMTALGAHSALVQLASEDTYVLEYQELRAKAYTDVLDALGDITVCLVNVCDQLDVDLVHDCYGPAVDVISKRKGKMVKGKFVKDE